MNPFHNRTEEINPVARQAEEQATRQALSPMDLPDGFSIPEADAVPYEALHPLLQGFIDEHRAVVGELDAFEEALTQVREHGIGTETSRALARFFRYFDEHVVPHNVREEKQLFTTLHERLLAARGPGRGAAPTTSVDVLEADHVKLLQMAAVSFNLFGLAGHLPDAASRALTFDAAVEQGFALIERLRLHILREDHVVFPLVQQHFSAEELDALHAAQAS